MGEFIFFVFIGNSHKSLAHMQIILIFAEKL